MPVRMFITAGPVADCSLAYMLIEGRDAECLLADKGYDSDALVEPLQQDGIKPVIQPRKCRKRLCSYDKNLHRLQHLIRNAFFKLKRRLGIATRNAKNTASFLAAGHIRCKAIWAKIK